MKLNILQSNTDKEEALLSVECPFGALWLEMMCSISNIQGKESFILFRHYVLVVNGRLIHWRRVTVWVVPKSSPWIPHRISSSEGQGPGRHWRLIMLRYTVQLLIWLCESWIWGANFTQRMKGGTQQRPTRLRRHESHGILLGSPRTELFTGMFSGERVYKGMELQVKDLHYHRICCSMGCRESFENPLVELNV